MKSQNKLSRIIAGTMNWGIWDKNLNSSEMAHMINLFVGNQISTFDHADIYGGYTTEAAFGAAFKQTNLSRNQIQLISKCGIQYPTEARQNRIKHYNYSREYIISSVESSLKNLQTDFLDVFLLHRPSPLMQADEIAEAVQKLKKEGKIIEFGVSNFTPSQMNLIHQKTPIAYNQIQFSATHFSPMLDGTLDFMQNNQITPMAWNPLGTIFREDTEQTRRLKKLFARLVEKYETGADLLLMAWLMRHPSGVLPLAGTVNAGRVQLLMKACEINLDLQDWFEIWVESKGSKVD